MTEEKEENKNNFAKGDPDCRCECCIYWRRHIHRVSLNKDKRISLSECGMRYWKKEAASLKAECRRWVKENIKLKNENFKLSSSSWFERVFWR